MLYIVALILFFALHAIPLNKALRKKATDRFGERRYRAMFRLAILACVALGVWGWSHFPLIYFYEPPVYMKQVHLAIMLVAVFLWVIAETPNNLKRHIRNPMLTGMKLWALGHLLANGDLRSMILFLSFMVFSLIAVIISNQRGAPTSIEPKPVSYDIGVVVASVIGYGIIAYFHGDLFGMPVTQYFAVG